MMIDPILRPLMEVPPSGNVKAHAFRLRPNEPLKDALLSVASVIFASHPAQDCSSMFVLTAVGSVRDVTLRLANASRTDGIIDNDDNNGDDDNNNHDDNDDFDDNAGDDYNNTHEKDVFVYDIVQEDQTEFDNIVKDMEFEKELEVESAKLKVEVSKDEVISISDRQQDENEDQNGRCGNEQQKEQRKTKSRRHRGSSRNSSNEIRRWPNQRFEIVSLVGTFSRDGSCHLHASLSDGEGMTIGGHLVDGIVFTTVEVVLGTASGIDFHRVRDDETGFGELRVASVPSTIAAESGEVGEEKRYRWGEILLVLVTGIMIGGIVSRQHKA